MVGTLGGASRGALEVLELAAATPGDGTKVLAKSVESMENLRKSMVN